jgi:hypothetical protein
MHGVLKGSLEHIALHHDKYVSFDSFLISFITSYPGVVLSEKLKKRYPDEMLIIIQYQFDDFVVLDDRFSITLYFDDKGESITIPYNAITSYVDKEANFALKFSVNRTEMALVEEEKKARENDDSSNVIFLDKFRK